MNNKIFFILFAVILVSIYTVYPQLPAEIATHWNLAGEADGYTGKFWGVFMWPILLLVLFIIYLIVPKIDPLKSNVESFRKHYNFFWLFMYLFIGYIFGLTMAWNLGVQFNMSVAMAPAFSVLLYLVGVVLSKAKRNWFLGIRTPWTLSSDETWDKTHRFGSKVFRIASLLPLLALLFRDSSEIFGWLLIVAFVIILSPIVYSYYVYKTL